jgi:hypothetical protein
MQVPYRIQYKKITGFEIRVARLKPFSAKLIISVAIERILGPDGFISAFRVMPFIVGFV